MGEGPGGLLVWEGQSRSGIEAAAAPCRALKVRINIWPMASKGNR